MTRLAAVLVLALACVGCGGGRRAAVPGCVRAATPLPQLGGVASATVPLPGQPFGVAVDGRYALVTVGGFSAFPQLGVVDLRRGTLVRQLPLPVEGAAGVTLTPDRSRLLVAAGSGLTEVDVRAAEAGRGRAVVASLSSGGELGSRRWSAIDVVSDRSGRYAFVSLEYAGRIAVFDLRRRRLVGTIRVPAVNVGLALSPDGRTLYATTASGAFPVTPPSAGSLTVIDVARAERDPAHAVVGAAPAGCNPVRVVATGDGSVWVSARGSNAVLEYSAKELRANPRAALEGGVGVGAEPVGLEPFDGGRRLLVLDSDRYGLAGGTPSLAIVDTTRRRVLGTVATGAFPREAAVAGDRLVVTDFAGAQLQTVRISRRTIAR